MSKIIDGPCAVPFKYAEKEKVLDNNFIVLYVKYDEKFSEIEEINQKFWDYIVKDEVLSKKNFYLTVINYNKFIENIWHYKKPEYVLFDEFLIENNIKLTK